MKDDTISRAAAIDAVNNMIRRKFGISADLGTGALLELPSAADTNVGGTDTISRQAAIDTLKNRWKKTRHYEGIGDDIAEECELYLKQVPPVTPKQPGWIPCSERLPEEPFACQVTVWDTNPVTMDEFENVLPYFVGWDGEQWNDANGEQCPFEVIAWQPQPTPYREGGQDGNK